MRLNEFGKTIEFTWNDLVNHNANIELDAFVVMPNHIHGIIMIVEPPDNTTIVGAGSEPALTSDSEPYTKTRKRHGLPEIVRQFKTFSAKQINQISQTPGTSVWQRNYYERIIRNETELNPIREYVATNPLNWLTDENFIG